MTRIFKTLCMCIWMRFFIRMVEPCEENGGQRSALVFYGSSFLTDETGEILAEAGRDEEEILVQEYDLDELDARRLECGLFRDRRPECYGIISGR